MMCRCEECREMVDSTLMPFHRMHCPATRPYAGNNDEPIDPRGTGTIDPWEVEQLPAFSHRRNMRL